MDSENIYEYPIVSACQIKTRNAMKMELDLEIDSTNAQEESCKQLQLRTTKN